MQTLREKITFVLTALAYLVFHIRTGPTMGSMISGTVEQLLTTAPYCIGFTFVLVAVIRYMHDGKRPAWDRIARIFFTIGILFAFYFALYEYGDRAEQERKKTVRAQQHPIRSLVPRLPAHGWNVQHRGAITARSACAHPESALTWSTAELLQDRG